MTKASDSIRAACSIELAPAVERLRRVSSCVQVNADELKREARKAAVDSAIRTGTPPGGIRSLGPGLHRTKDVRAEAPFEDAPTRRYRTRS